MNNFEFLKSIDKELYNIISDAEKLYRDEYFEQCITQTRRFGENICRNVVGETYSGENTFDQMLATLKDKPNKTPEEKEFLDDLYFIKREGNSAVHGTEVKNKGTTALECLQRSFEVAINFAVYHKKADENILNLHYDTELLITGQKSSNTLANKYQKVKKSINNKKSSTSTKKQVHTMPTKSYSKDIKFPIIFVCTMLILSSIFALIIYLLTL